MMTLDHNEETSRLAALREYQILDTDEEQEFNDIVELARLICQTPVGLVSLVDTNRQWFKAKTGTDLCETPIEQAVCAHAIREPEILIIPDLTADPRTANNTLVTQDPNIRFYAGAVLRTPAGEALGTVCVLDVVPHPQGLTSTQTAGLKALARQAMHALELRKITFAQIDALGIEQANSEDMEARLRDSVVTVRLQRALVELGDALQHARSRAAAIATGIETLVNELGLYRAGFATIDDEAKQFVVVHDLSAARAASTVGRYDLVETLPIIDRLRHGETVSTADYRSDAGLAGDKALFEAVNAVASINVPIVRDGQFRALLFAHGSSPRVWNDSEVDFVRGVADRVFAATVKIDAELQQSVLNQELSHRMKNMFSMVQAISAQTLRDVTEKETVQLFNTRILALSTAHSLLLEHNWASARVRQVLEATLGPHYDMARFHLSGPNVQLEAKTALSLSLLVHELATNAVKYGSLSIPAGSVRVIWSIDRLPGGSQFVLTWTEDGGPTVVEPKRRGFGSRIIAMGLGSSSRGEVKYNETGLHAEFRAPLSVVLD